MENKLNIFGPELFVCIKVDRSDVPSDEYGRTFLPPQLPFVVSSSPQMGLLASMKKPRESNIVFVSIEKKIY